MLKNRQARRKSILVVPTLINDPTPDFEGKISIIEDAESNAWKDRQWASIMNLLKQIGVTSAQIGGQQLYVGDSKDSTDHEDLTAYRQQRKTHGETGTENYGMRRCVGIAVKYFANAGIQTELMPELTYPYSVQDIQQFDPTYRSRLTQILQQIA